MSAYTQRPCLLTDVFAVTGGGMVKERSKAWIITPTEVDGKKTGEIYERDHLTGKFLGNNFAMVDHIRHLRNEMVKEQMKEQIDGTLNKPKRELVDKLPKVLTVIVKTASVVASVNVLTEWRGNGVLQLEITLPNLELLLEQPPAESAPWTPKIESADVHWRTSTNALNCKYWDSRAMKYKSKTIAVDVGSEVDDEAKQDLVDRAKVELEEYYASHHNRDGNMPGSDDMTSEAGGGDSVPKRMKTGEEENTNGTSE